MACLAVCVSASAAGSYVVVNRFSGLYSIPSGDTINSSVGGALDLAVDGSGNYIIATRHSDRRSHRAGALSTISTAPSGYQWVSVALDGSGNFIVADNQVHGIWRISADGLSRAVIALYPICTTNNLEDVFVRVDSLGRYVILHDNCPALSAYTMTSTGTVTPISLSGTLPSRIGGFTFDATGNYVITDYNNNVIDLITPGGALTTLAPNSAPLAGQILGIARDPASGNYIVANRSANTLVSVSSNGTSVATIFSGAPLNAPVSVVPIPVSVSRNKLNFGATTDGQVITSAQSVLIAIPAGTGWTATSNTNFITLVPASGTGSKSLTVDIDSTKVPTTPSTSTGTITITSAAAGNPTATITVTLNVFAPAIVGLPFGSFDTPRWHHRRRRCYSSHWLGAG